MLRNIYGLQIRIDEKDVILTQEKSACDDAVVIISPDQIPLLISWLKEAQKAFTNAQR